MNSFWNLFEIFFIKTSYIFFKIYPTFRYIFYILSTQAFAKQFQTTPDDLDMHLIYDVSHNVAKIEEHIVDGRQKRLLVHRKGATRAFPPHHPLIPVDYQLTGQPVLVGGTMGTCSYVLTGTEKGMTETFGSTCHGAVSECTRFLPKLYIYIGYSVQKTSLFCCILYSNHLRFKIHMAI